MKINCLHGFYQFIEEDAGDISNFSGLFGFDMVFEKGYYTYSFLSGAPRYAIKGSTYLGAPVTKTFEGDPWDIMRENDLIYDFTNDEVVPISTITTKVQIDSAADYYLANGMILPGSITADGTRVKEYAAHYSFATGRIKYSGVELG